MTLGRKSQSKHQTKQSLLKYLNKRYTFKTGINTRILHKHDGPLNPTQHCTTRVTLQHLRSMQYLILIGFEF